MSGHALLPAALIVSLSLVASLYISATWWTHALAARALALPPANGSEFDFVVVGSGTAGSAVAARLAEYGHDVLLVEAGGPSHWMQVIDRNGHPEKTRSLSEGAT